MIPAYARRHANLLIDRLLDKWTTPMTMPEMRKATGLSEPTIWRYVNRMIEQYPGPVPRQAHISGWTRGKSGRAAIAVYSRGPGEDAPLDLTIQPRTVAERAAVYHARQRVEQTQEANERAERFRAIRPYRDPLTAALFGAPNAN